MSVPVADQDAALRFYTQTLGCEVRTDVEVWPGARMIEVVPPGSSVALVLLPRDGQIPVAIRLGTDDAQLAHETVRAAGVPCTTKNRSGWRESRRSSPSPTLTVTGWCTWKTPNQAGLAKPSHPRTPVR